MDVVSSTGSGSSTSRGVPSKFELKTEDFIKMMITQLQNQDPLEPAKNEQLLSQMSQIGQLESSTQLQQSLKTMVLQNNLGASGNLIGKHVTGLGEFAGETVSIDGIVTSVHVQGDDVWLELDNGNTLKLENITEVTTA